MLIVCWSELIELEYYWIRGSSAERGDHWSDLADSRQIQVGVGRKEGIAIFSEVTA